MQETKEVGPLRQFFRQLVGLLLAESRHRSDVVRNLLCTELEDAEETSLGYLIRVCIPKLICAASP